MKNGEKRGGVGFTAVLAAGLLVAVVLTVVSLFAASRRAAEYELARLGLEDVAHRVERGVRNLRSVREMSDAVALSRARSLAQLVAENPSVLASANRAKFDSYAQMLGVDELHVTDCRGILVRCHPSVYEGHDMAASAQSAAFLPALTNASFALVQEPQGKGLATGDDRQDDQIFQYAGVARRDAPGIVQVGYRASRVAEAMRLADIDQIAESTRVGRRGRVRIVKLADAGVSGPVGVRHERDAAGASLVVFETDCEGYRISVVMPEVGGGLADEGTFGALLVFDLVLALLLVGAFPTVRNLLLRDLRGFVAQLRPRGEGVAASYVRMFTTPLALMATLAFVVMLVAIGFVSARQARMAACERLRAAAADIVDDLDDCVGKQLAFIGRTICEIHGSPEGMAGADLAPLMKAHGLDELNVIDGRGVIVASTVDGIVGDDQWRKANPAKFNQALLKDGHAVYAQSFRESADEPGNYYKYVGVAFPPPARGYVQLGFKRARLQDSIDYSLEGLASNWHIGESGFFVISKTKNGVILSAGPDEFRGKTLAEVGFDVFTARERQNVERRDPVSQEFLGFVEVHIFASEFAGRRCLCTSGVSNQFHRYVAAIPVAEIFGPVRRTVAATAVVLFAALVLVVFFMTRISDKNRALEGFIQKDKEQREKDLAIASTIQMSSLPAVFPNECDWKIFARMDTAREVGGDFYDFVVLPSGKVLFLIADVSGKGIPAAMFMMKAKTTLRASVQGGVGLADVVRAANDRLAENNDANMFVTAWIGLFDPATGAIEYVNAGHNPPLVKRADGSVEWVRGRRGLVLAAMAGVKYHVETLHLASGDSLCLYTDGVTEAVNPALELYGEARLEAALRAAGPLFVEGIRRDVASFANGAEQADDITLLALDRKRI